MNHAAAAAEFIADDAHAHWHDQALWFVRAKRDKCAHGLAEWEELRERAAAIKRHTIAQARRSYLEQFEANATRLGADGPLGPRRRRAQRDRPRPSRSGTALRRVVKSKSMLTEECGLNPYLERRGIEVIDTDLGEWIVQLRARAPQPHRAAGDSHHEGRSRRAVPRRARHRGRRDRSDVSGRSGPAAICGQKFLAAEAGITGVNFAIAETGGFVVCTNEGNADLGMSLPKLHIACMGIEKLIPRAADLGVFLRLLARSATGQPITTYTSHFHGPRPGGELHIVLVDNGRTKLLGERRFPPLAELHSLRRVLQHVPRLSPQRRAQLRRHGRRADRLDHQRRPAIRPSITRLPFACSLCGSCTDVCPVKIDLHHQLLAWRSDSRGEAAHRTLEAAADVARGPRAQAAVAVCRRRPRGTFCPALDAALARLQPIQSLGPAARAAAAAAGEFSRVVQEKDVRS